MPIADGAAFAGYTIERLLGAGGMGEVYLVQHPRLPRREALKILPTNVSADPQYRRRFEREADIAASLWHPHVVAVHDRGEHDGQLWIAMDYIEGTDAAALVRERYPHGMPPKDVLEIVAAIADALDYAHERYLLHRDVKPSNVLITDPRKGERRILLADFGIARDTNDIEGLTATNMTVGSIAYAAPEQLTGKALDGRADQYALASTAFHLLTGDLPFAHSNPAVVIGNKLSSSPPRLGSLRADLGAIDNVLAKAMATEPFHRFDTCRDFTAALARDIAGSTSSTDTTQLATPIPTPLRGRTTRRFALIAGGLAALIAVGVVAFIGTRLAQPDSKPSASATQPSATLPGTSSTESPFTVTYTPPPVMSTRPGAPPTVLTPPPTTSPGLNRAGDLGLTTPISKPSCNGQGIVVLGSVTTPGLYADGVQRLLDAHPGSYYLRTDETCPSLRPATDEGNPIYAVFIPGGSTQSAVCAKVRAAGDGAYGKWLDYTTDPGYVIAC
jgi:serine/threonine protein kinase, bacterial